MPGIREWGIARRRMEPGAVGTKEVHRHRLVFPLLLHTFLRFAEQACSPLHHGWV